MNGGALKSLIILAESVLNDIEDWCGTSTSLDLKTVKRRVKEAMLKIDHFVHTLHCGFHESVYPRQEDKIISLVLMFFGWSNTQ